MREILFRGKRVDNGEWVYGCFIYGVKQKKGKSYILPENIDQPGCHHLDGFEVIPESVGQFTGLLDKDGTKIFEHDLLRNHGDIWVIVFDKGSFFAKCHYPGNYEGKKWHGQKELHLWLQYVTGRCDDNTVIGNLHDNPELLK